VRSTHSRKQPVETFLRIRRRRQLQLDAPIAIEPPRVNADGWPAVTKRERDFGKRAQTATEGYDAVGRLREDRVPAMAEVRRNHDVDVRVGIRRIVPRKQADREPAGIARASGRVLHDPGEPSADEDRTSLRNPATELERFLRE